MSTPYTHPSMPGTRYLGNLLPAAATASPPRPSPWLTVEEALALTRAADKARAAFPSLRPADVQGNLDQDALLEDAYRDAEGQTLVQAIHDRKAQESA